MAIFAKVVETGSFRAAAKALGLSPSVVSHHVSRLEAQIGTSLLHRTTRHLSLTADGRRLFQASSNMLAAAREGLDAFAGGAAEPSGELRVAVPAPLVSSPFIAYVAQFAESHPRVRLRLSFDDKLVDLLGGSFDLAIRTGQPREPHLGYRKLREGIPVLCASPSYLARRGEPATPAALEQHEWVWLTMRPPAIALERIRGGPLSQAVTLRPRVLVDNTPALRALALEGVGLAVLPRFAIDADLEDGRLRPILPGWRLPGPGIFAVWPASTGPSALGQRFLDFMIERLDLLDGADTDTMQAKTRVSAG